MTAWIERATEALSPWEGWIARRVSRHRARLEVRSGGLDAPEHLDDCGVMVTVWAHGGVAHAATADLGVEGLRDAGRRAARLARMVARHAPSPAGAVPKLAHGTFAAPILRPWSEVALTEKIDRLMSVRPAFETPTIVDWRASLEHVHTTTELATSRGGHLRQEQVSLHPSLLAIGAREHDVALRSRGRQAARQTGFELFDALDWPSEAAELVDEIEQLLAAPPCPTRRMDVLIAPDQMAMQIHESIGHPLELDRILGDERNFYGTTFVTPAMIGSFRYGSELLDVTFDPTDPQQVASYAWDDEGSPARREAVIRDGIVVRALGGASSRARAGVPGVACSRASGWWRAPIDRMANLNIEPGASSMDQLVSAVDQGIFLQTNLGFSIDDRREDFQFTTEWGRLIEHGRLTTVVRKPTYRGRTVPFWRSLVGVGDRSTYSPHGTPWCGKGEPQQRLMVGHGSPACLFAGIDVRGAG